VPLVDTKDVIFLASFAVGRVASVPGTWRQLPSTATAARKDVASDVMLEKRTRATSAVWCWDTHRASAMLSLTVSALEKIQG